MGSAPGTRLAGQVSQHTGQVLSDPSSIRGNRVLRESRVSSLAPNELATFQVEDGSRESVRLRGGRRGDLASADLDRDRPINSEVGTIIGVPGIPDATSKADPAIRSGSDEAEEIPRQVLRGKLGPIRERPRQRFRQQRRGRPRGR